MQRLSRREFLRVSSLVAAGTVAAACAQPTAAPAPTSAPAAQATNPPAAQPTAAPTKVSMPPTAVPQPTAEPAARYNEAPQLAELVAQGKLPPVEERLPLNPTICPTLEGTGKYGGTIRRGFKGVSDGTGAWKMTANFLVDYTADLSLRPDICEAWELSADATEYTFHLREGMKWSDGTPFTSADFQWWYEKRLLNTDITPKPGQAYTSGPDKVVMVQTAPDDYTVVYKFAHPSPLFIYQLAMSDVFEPAEYMKQWHKDTADAAKLEAEVAERGLQAWNELYNDRVNPRLNAECPEMGPWKSTTTLSDELFVCERNPYFWQVDSDGNQLPYVDTLTHRLFETVDVFNMWVMNGEIDYQGRHVELSNYTLFKEGEAQGKYQVRTAANDGTQIICINQTVKNPALREFFGNANCRKAMSYAINRDEIIEMIYDGLTKPRQYSPSDASPQYYEKLAKAYIEYDPDLANEMLDAEGYTERDAEGYRMFKDGSGPITFILEDNTAPFIDEMNMVATYLKDVGIKMLPKILERSLVEEHCQANEIDARFTLASRAALPIVDPAFFLGFAGDKSFGYAWSIWFNNPTSPNAEEPPEGGLAKEMWKIWDAIKVEPDTSKHTEMFYGVLDLHYEYCPYIGISGEQPALIIVAEKLKGLPPDYIMPWSNPIQHDGFIPLQSLYWDA